MPMKAKSRLPPSYFDAVNNEAVNEYGLTEDIVKWLPIALSWIKHC